MHCYMFGLISLLRDSFFLALRGCPDKSQIHVSTMCTFFCTSEAQDSRIHGQVSLPAWSRTQTAQHGFEVAGPAKGTALLTLRGHSQLLQAVEEPWEQLLKVLKIALLWLRGLRVENPEAVLWDSAGSQCRKQKEQGSALSSPQGVCSWPCSSAEDEDLDWAAEADDWSQVCSALGAVLNLLRGCIKENW